MGTTTSCESAGPRTLMAVSSFEGKVALGPPEGSHIGFPPIIGVGSRVLGPVSDLRRRVRFGGSWRDPPRYRWRRLVFHRPIHRSICAQDQRHLESAEPGLRLHDRARAAYWRQNHPCCRYTPRGALASRDSTS